MHRIASETEIRSHFPALSRIINDQPVAYFDGPGGTQVPREVGEAMTDYLYHHNANTHWAYPASNETDEALLAARATFADFLHAKPEEISFGANMTTLVFHLARSIGRQLNAGDEIVITDLDHHANIDPWRALEVEKGVRIKSVRFDTKTGQLDLAHLADLLSDEVKVLAIGGASNALGTINDLKQATSLAQQAGAYVFVDAVHYAPHKLVDVQAIGCDFLACSPYKFYGPHLGVLFGKHELLEQLSVPKLLPAPNHNGERLETGTQNHEGIVGAAAAVNFLADLHPEPSLDRRLRLQLVFDTLHQRGHDLISHLWNSLQSMNHVTVYGPSPEMPRTPTVSFTVDGLSSEEVTRQLSNEGIFTSHGDFYATTVVHKLGLSEEGLVRAGCACYTTQNEVDRLIAGVESLNRVKH